MAKSSKRAYWINLAKTNPDEYRRRSRMAYWQHLREANPEEFKARQRENKLRAQHPDMSREQAAKIIATQDKLFNENQLSLF